MTTSDDQKQNEEKLYAGKFKSIEDLENGYKNSAAVYDENEKLKKEIEEFKTTPHEYLNPKDVELDQNRIEDIKARAKEAGMTQAQYEKFVMGDKARVEKHKQGFEEAKKAVGEQTLNILQDYVNKYYPKEIGEQMMKSLIADKTAREAALKHRDSLLNTTVNGLNRPAQGGYHVTQEDIDKAYAKKEKHPGDLKARQHYLNLLEAKAAQKAS
jgi:hypothetical protein